MIRYDERPVEMGAVPFIGTVGDSYDNAPAKTVNGYDKAELIHRPARSGPWKTVEDVEATAFIADGCLGTNPSVMPIG